MRLFGFPGILLATICLGGCGPEHSDADASHHGGRYQGIGVYGAGQMWQHIVRSRSGSGDERAATPGDDEVVIAVVDSRTGEIRQCGNITGYCVRMNPWQNQLGPAQTLPAAVDSHLPEVELAARERWTGDVQKAAAPADASDAATDRPQPARH